MTSPFRERTRHNQPNKYGEIDFTLAASTVRDEARRRDPRARRDPRRATRSGRPPAPRTDRRRQRPSSSSGASAARPAHQRTTRDPHPTSGEPPQTRTRGRTTDGTDASHRQFAAQPPDQAQSTAEAKGGSEATVKIAKADLVPTDHNLRDAVSRIGRRWRRRARSSWPMSTRARTAPRARRR